MEKMLVENDFKYLKDSNEWIKDNWTLRILDNEIEIYESDTSKNPKYFKCSATEKNLEKILNDI